MIRELGRKLINRINNEVFLCFTDSFGITEGKSIIEKRGFQKAVRQISAILL